jgi:SNF2 family DNA or RNA helicase
MDRCHRIGQQKPVLVFRLATSHSVEGKMLARACGKMALERLVIKKGVFKEVLDTSGKVRPLGWCLAGVGVSFVLWCGANV